MSEELDRLVWAASRVLACQVHPVPKAEWEARGHRGGEPAKLAVPLSPFSSVDQSADVETYAMSARPAVPLGGFHVVRRDPVDAPNIFNTDSYPELDLLAHPKWQDIVSMARLDDSPELRRLVAGYVFLVGPTRRSDHHSPQVPGDIDGAKPK